MCTPCSRLDDPPEGITSGTALLMINDLSYLKLDRRGAEPLFHVLTEGEERNSAAIVDRLTYHGTIIETVTHAHRLATAEAT